VNSSSADSNYVFYALVFALRMGGIKKERKEE
jgi:hypothetical protein